MSAFGAALSSADASTITFTDKSSFLSSVCPERLESFENTPLRPEIPDPLALDGLVVTSTTASGPNAFAVSNLVDPNSGAHPTDGAQYLVPAGGYPYTVTFTFQTPINSFGIDIIDFGDGFTSGSLFLTTNTGDNFTIAAVPPFLANGNVLFFGILNTSASFTEVSINKTTSDEGISLDSLYFQATTTLSVAQGEAGTEVDLQQLNPGLTHDLVRGDLDVLRSSAGDFTAALDAIVPGTDVCMANDTMAASVLDTRFDPPTGNGWFYLARCLASTYNSGSSSQQGDRDSEIAASANACP